MVISDQLAGCGADRSRPMPRLPIGRHAIPHPVCYVRPGETTIEDREIVTGHRPSLKARRMMQASPLVRWLEAPR
jgi:hypothetical protein